MRRYEFPELPQRSAEAEYFFAADDSPDAVLLLQGRGLPHGNQQFIEVKLRWLADPVHATFLAKTLSTIDFHHDVPFTAPQGRVELSGADCAPLLASLLEAAAPVIESMVFDGFPCTLVALERTPFRLLTYYCNLAGISEAFAEHPVPVLRNALLTLSRRAAAPMTWT